MVAEMKEVLRLNPVNPPSMCLSNLARSYQMIGRYEESVRFYKRLLQDQPNHLPGNTGLTVIYSMMGRMEEARTQAAEVLRLNPKFSLERHSKNLRFKNPEDAERYIDALRKAGLEGEGFGRNRSKPETHSCPELGRLTQSLSLPHVVKPYAG
jgi:adenylate cyclase